MGREMVVYRTGKRVRAWDIHYWFPVGGNMSQNRPTWSRSLIPDSDDEFIDDSYGERELAEKDYDELRSIAAEHPSEDVHGRMGKEDLRNALEGLERV